MAAARVAVLVSGTGTLLQALLDAYPARSPAVEIVAVGSDRAEAVGLQRAKHAGVETFVVPPGAFDERDAWDAALADELRARRPDLVVCAGFLRLLGPAVLTAFPQRLLNSHPALLPSFPGLHAVRDALRYGVRVTGLTVHLVDAGVDTGPVLAQVPVPVEPDDDEASLHERIKQAERRTLVEVVGRVARTGFTVEGRTVRW